MYRSFAKFRGCNCLKGSDFTSVTEMPKKASAKAPKLLNSLQQGLLLQHRLMTQQLACISMTIMRGLETMLCGE